MNWNLTSRDIIRAIKKDNWEHVSTEGSHWQFKHSIKEGRVTVPHPKKFLGIKTIKSILKQADLTPEEFEMLKVNSYPAILEPTEDGYSVYFPDLPGAISTGEDYEDTIMNAEECLSLHLYGMMTDGEELPDPSPMSEMLKEGELVALIHPDVFGVQARQEDKAVRVNISFPKALLEAVDSRARQLGIDRSKLLQKAAREAVVIESGPKTRVTGRRFKKELPKIINRK